MDWYPFYFNIYEADTIGLNPYQDGCYRRLIDHYMRTRQPLPDNDYALARIVGDSVDNWVNNARAMVVPYFTHSTSNGITILKHDFCDKILKEQDARNLKKTMSGKKGAEKRWSQSFDNKKENSTTIADPMPNDSTRQDKTRQDSIKDNVYLGGSTPKPKPKKLIGMHFRSWFDREKEKDPDISVNSCPDLLYDVAVEMGMERMAIDEWSKFHDYWIAKTGSGSVKSDWVATWRNWLRNSKKYMKG